MKIRDGMFGLELAVKWGLTLNFTNWKKIMIGLKLLTNVPEEYCSITTLRVQLQESQELFLVILIGFISNLRQIILLLKKAFVSKFGALRKVIPKVSCDKQRHSDSIV